jgi:hypothetical protein
MLVLGRLSARSFVALVLLLLLASGLAASGHSHDRHAWWALLPATLLRLARRWEEQCQQRHSKK